MLGIFGLICASKGLIVPGERATSETLPRHFRDTSETFRARAPPHKFATPPHTGRPPNPRPAHTQRHAWHNSPRRPAAASRLCRPRLARHRAGDRRADVVLWAERRRPPLRREHAQVRHRELRPAAVDRVCRSAPIWHSHPAGRYVSPPCAVTGVGPSGSYHALGRSDTRKSVCVEPREVPSMVRERVCTI